MIGTFLSNLGGNKRAAISSVVANGDAPSGPLPVFPAGASSWVKPSQTALVAATDTVIAFTGNPQIFRSIIQNNTTATLYWSLDNAAGTGSFQLAAGQTLFLDNSGVLHLYASAATSLNVANGVAILAATGPNV